MKGKCGTPLRRYATGQASDLLRRMAFQASRASRSAGPDPVHDLRVSIRRLNECLSILGTLFPGGKAKRVRRKLDALMDLASEVRNRDITLELLNRAEVPAGSPLVRVLSEERDQAEQALTAALRRWSRRDSHRKWRTRLGL